MYDPKVGIFTYTMYVKYRSRGISLPTISFKDIHTHTFIDFNLLSMLDIGEGIFL